MKSLFLLLAITLFSACNIRFVNFNDWSYVTSPKAGYRVLCPQKRDDGDLISVKFEEKKVNKDGFINCRVGEATYFLHSMDWNVAHNQTENVESFFETLSGYGLPDGDQIVLTNGRKGVQVSSESFQLIEQHFIFDKTAFHLQVKFEDSATGNTKQGKLTEEQSKIAQRFFDSFEIIEK
jgi:hypothetical protein